VARYTKDDYKREGEQTLALRLYATTHLQNATVTGDALNNNKPQARALLDAGGDYFFQLKNENRHAYKAALQKAKATPFCPHRRAGHQPRTLGPAPDKSLVYPFEPLEAGLPGARSLVVIKRTSTFDENQEPTIAFYTTSHSPIPGCARHFGDLARGHWVRDACMRTKTKPAPKTTTSTATSRPCAAAWWRSRPAFTPSLPGPSYKSAASTIPKSLSKHSSSTATPPTWMTSVPAPKIRASDNCSVWKAIWV